MTLRVFTARIGTRGLTDGLDVTRKSAQGDGLAFAPSWTILRRALDEMRAARAVFDDSLLQVAWERYVPAYLDEMRASYRRDRGPWDRLLARESVTLLCYCNDAQRCHRTLLAERILPKLGAIPGIGSIGVVQ